MASHSIVRRQARNPFALLLLSQLLLLAMYGLTAPPVRAGTIGDTHSHDSAAPFSPNCIGESCRRRGGFAKAAPAETVYAGNVITVERTDDNGSSIPGNCPGWCRFRDAVAKAAAGDTITFDPVVFSVPVTIPLQVMRIQITKTLTIDGSTAPVTPTISGPGDSCIPTPTPTNCFNVFEVLSGDVTMNRLRIINGRLASGGGAGIWTGAVLTVTNSEFSNNMAPGSYGYGAALSGSPASSMTVINSKFSGNSAYQAGAIYTHGSLTVTNSVLSGNSAAHGGGAMFSGGNLTMLNTVFSGNTAGTDGGAMLFNGSGDPVTANIMNTVFLSNTAGISGGGIELLSGPMTITNSTFWNNSAADDRYGGAIYNSSGSLTLLNSTLANNRAGNAGGVQNFGTATLKNTIIAKGALGANCLGNQLDGGSTNNLNDDSGCGSSFVHSNSLLLGTLGNYGGSMDTIPLLPNSPAIDAGEATACPATDQRGIARPSQACDIGAFESQGFTFTSLTGTSQSAVANTAFATPLGLTVVPTGTLEPVDGGQVVFSAPSGSGVASLSSPVITATISAGHVSQAVTANGVAGGPYNVVASARGAANAYFALTNGAKVLLPFIRR